MPIEWEYCSNNIECHWQWGYCISIYLECDSVSIGDESVAQFSRPTMMIFKDVEGITMKSCVYNECLGLSWGYCRPSRLATNVLPYIDENIAWFFGLIVMV